MLKFAQYVSKKYSLLIQYKKGLKYVTLENCYRCLKGSGLREVLLIRRMEQNDIAAWFNQVVRDSHKRQKVNNLGITVIDSREFEDPRASKDPRESKDQREPKGQRGPTVPRVIKKSRVIK